jgi:hypothetical protein
VKTELFPEDFVLELKTKNLGNFSSFPTISHTIMSAKWFRSYKIFTIDIVTELCFWTDQQQNGSSVSSLRLAETLEVPEYQICRQLSQLSNGP